VCIFLGDSKKNSNNSLKKGVSPQAQELEIW